jgi:hypothetical protein
MSTQGSESSFGLQTNPIQRTTNCSCLRGLPMHEEMKTRTLPLLGLSGAPGRSRQWHHSYPGPVLRPWGLFSSFSIFQFLSCSRNIAVTRKGPWKESKHCPQAIQIALLEGLNWPCSYKSAVWPVLPAKGLGLPQAGLWTTCSSSAPFSSLSLGYSGFSKAGPSPAWPSSAPAVIQGKDCL